MCKNFQGLDPEGQSNKLRCSPIGEKLDGNARSLVLAIERLNVFELLE